VSSANSLGKVVWYLCRLCQVWTKGDQARSLGGHHKLYSFRN